MSRQQEGGWGKKSTAFCLICPAIQRDPLVIPYCFMYLPNETTRWQDKCDKTIIQNADNFLPFCIDIYSALYLLYISLLGHKGNEKLMQNIVFSKVDRRKGRTIVTVYNLPSKNKPGCLRKIYMFIFYNCFLSNTAFQ